MKASIIDGKITISDFESEEQMQTYLLILADMLHMEI